MRMHLAPNDGWEPDWIDPITEGAAHALLAPLTFDEFVSMEEDDPESLLGTKDENVIPAQSLTLFVAKGGQGKTTDSIDLVFHLAGGRNWLGINVARPLRILFIENEGARGPFRRKMARKRDLYVADRIRRSEDIAWPRSGGGILFPPPSLGRIDIRREDHREWLRSTVERNGVDVIVGDTANTLGMEGAGAPDEIRSFVRHLEAVRGTSMVSFLLLHHPRKLGRSDNVNDVQAGSGDWQGAPDTILSLKRTGKNEALLHFTKVRYHDSLNSRTALVSFDPETQALTFLKFVDDSGKDDEDERDVAPEIEEFLAGGPQTVPDIARELKVREQDVRDALKAGDQFRMLSRDEAKKAGRHPTAKVWMVTPK